MGVTTPDHDFAVGERGFNYYDHKWGTVIRPADDTGWFTVRQDDGQTKILNDERFVTPEVAARHDYGEDPMTSQNVSVALARLADLMESARPIGRVLDAMTEPELLCLGAVPDQLGRLVDTIEAVCDRKEN